MVKALNIPQLIEVVITNLMVHEQKRHQDCINNLVLSNSRDGHIIHGGETYLTTITNSRIRVPLDEELWPDMELFLKDRRAVIEDSRIFMQVLLSLLEPCESMQDARDALPDFLASLVPELQHVVRIKEEAFTIKHGNPRIYRQYLKHREKMEFYFMMQKNPSMADLMSFYNFTV